MLTSIVLPDIQFLEQVLDCVPDSDPLGKGVSVFHVHTPHKTRFAPFVTADKKCILFSFWYPGAKM